MAQKVYLTNAFSAGMLLTPAIVEFREMTLEQVKRLLSMGFVSAVGHASTASLLTQLLGLEVQTNRVNVQLKFMDRAVIFQLQSRLEEGKVLTEDELKQIKYKFILATVL